MELWGGLECTTARIGDTYRDQIVETGHRDRPDDLERIAQLGIATLRYPVLWETVAPDKSGNSDWAWHDSRLRRLRDLDVGTIAGLVHHGSGPRHTNLLDPAFPDLLADYAGSVARRYPWIESFTPVNEPLTTARFSALYGHWHPHLHDTGSFLRALVIQCKAVVLAMRAIRRVTPAARLVQTEDLGKTFATPRLADQAAYENERRWLSLDLLCGKVDGSHPWRQILLANGVMESDLSLFLEGDAVPDILGINHYLTSERYLDHRRERYPRHLWGGNGRDGYADVEAVRMHLPLGSTGPEARLREAVLRYGLPIAVTEVHHGCTREEQLRWLVEVWTAAQALRDEGADIRAVTLWSLFGAYDWNSLLVRQTGFYEPGAFDIRSDPPRPTAIATAALELGRTGGCNHPVLDRHGWWHREERFYHAPTDFKARRGVREPRKLLILGADSMIGDAFARICFQRGLDFEGVKSHSGGRVCDPATVAHVVERVRPWAMIDATGLSPAAGTGAGIPILRIASDRIVDGHVVRVGPIGGTEDADALTILTGPLFGPWDRSSVVVELLSSLSAGHPVLASTDVASPAFLPDAVHAALDLLIDGAKGTWRLAGGDAEIWRDIARRIATIADLDPDLVISVPSAGASVDCPGAHRLALPSFDSAIGRYFADRTFDPADLPREAAE